MTENVKMYTQMKTRSPGGTEVQRETFYVQGFELGNVSQIVRNIGIGLHNGVSVVMSQFRDV